MTVSTAARSIYQLKITLQGTRPPVWRRLRVQSDVTLRKLHDIFQVAMGWTNTHLYEFEADGRRFGERDPEFGSDDVRSARRTKLNQIAPYAGAQFRYEYDFGDGWRHAIVVEKVMAPEDGVRYPICVAGRRACPPEDCGGTWGYSHLLGILARPDHPEHAEWLEWVGGQFDPEAFDLRDTNEALRLGPVRPLGVFG